MTYPDDQKQIETSTGEGWPGGLACGNRLIDSEHRALLERIDNLKRICSDYHPQACCQSCSAEHRRECESKLLGMLGEVIEFVIEHFEHEEALMRRTLLPIMNAAAYDEHVEAHADISAAVIGILSSLSPEITVEKIRDLEQSLYGWLVGHIYQHDLPLADWIKREDSMLNEI